MKKTFRTFLVVMALTAMTVDACDLCAIYMAQEATGARPGPGAGLAVQYTRFETLVEDGDEISNPLGEELDSLIAQLALSYRFDHAWGMQLTVPYIDRSFETGGEDGSESGIGDVTLLGTVRVAERLAEETTFAVDLFGGIKAPTGDSDRLDAEPGHHDSEEEAEEEHAHDDEELPSGLHAHDLALGSGSWDVVAGASSYARCERWFLLGAAQYTLRTEGDHDYEFGDDLQWAVTPGWYARLEHAGTVGLGARLSGEFKAEDERDGETESGTEVTTVYLGPDILLTRGSHVEVDLAAEFPLHQDNEGITLFPDYRIKAAGSWRF